MQLYRAVLSGENRTEFLERFNSPRAKVAEALAHCAKSTVMVQNVGSDKALTLADTALSKKT